MPSAFAYPEPAEAPECALVAIDLQLLPFVLGAAAELQDRRYWQSDLDWYRACEAISDFLRCAMSACLGDFLAGQDRLYRLLDSALNGTVYTADGDPVVITPEIPAVPPEVAQLPGMIARLDHLEIMLDALPGVLDPGWFGYGGSKATIADVVRSLRIGNEIAGDDLGETLSNILGTAGDIGDIGELIAQLFSTGVSTVAEGGILAVLAAGTVGNLAGLGALSSQLTNMAIQNARIINTLDGGALGGPGDNILQAIRGDVEASAERNVIDSTVAALATLAEGNPEVLAKLEEIRLLLV